MEKLATEDLKSIVRQIVDNFLGKIIYDIHKIYGLATETLRHYLGDKWVDQNAFAFIQERVLTENRKGRNFLRTGDPIAENSFRHELRIFQLAELIFNLQSIYGIDGRIAAIKEGGLESTYGELECAAQIKKANLSFRFITPSGIKGRDYDIEIISALDTYLNCELKVTTEEKDLQKSILVNKLIAARKQLPERQPGIIFLKIPESWHKRTSAQHLLIENVLWELNNPKGKGWIRFRDIVEQVQN